MLPKNKAPSRYIAPILVVGVAIAGAAFAGTTPGTTSLSSTAATTVTVVDGPVQGSLSSASAVATPTSAISKAVASASPQVVPNVPSIKVLGGVNISGGEFGKVPGRNGYDYSYPDTAEIDIYKKLGFKIIRIPFRWERLQPVLYGPLSAGDQAGLKKAVDYATSQGLTVVLDMHDYGARNVSGTRMSLGSGMLSESTLVDAWTKIASDYQGNTQVWLGLMNEPGGDMSDWWRIVQQLVIDLRGQRITNKVLVPGTSWTGAHSWLSSGNAVYAAKFMDPAANYAFEVHQYLDNDSSGTHANCSVGAGKRVDAVLNWAQQSGKKLFMGEMGAGPDSTCQAEYDGMIAKLNASPAVLGWTGWGGGKWWNTGYFLRLDPINGLATPHLQMLEKNLPK